MVDNTPELKRIVNEWGYSRSTRVLSTKERFVYDLWWELKVKRTKKQAKRVLNEMTIEELETRYAMWRMQRET